MSAKLSFTLEEYRVREDGVWVTTVVGVERTDDFVGAVSCRVGNTSSSSSGRGTRNKDYIVPHGTGTGQILQWADGESGIKFCDFTITNDEFVEGNESIPLTLGTFTGGAIKGEISFATLIITDDDFLVPQHRWLETSLQFQHPDQSWGISVDLQGVSGISGASGDKGEKGDRGDKGDKGNVGDSGSSGAQGVQGVQGDRGLQGPQGAIGLQGFPGTSAPGPKCNQLTIPVTYNGTNLIQQFAGVHSQQILGITGTCHLHGPAGNAVVPPGGYANGVPPISPIPGQNGAPGQVGTVGSSDYSLAAGSSAVQIILRQGAFNIGQVMTFKILVWYE